MNKEFLEYTSILLELIAFLLVTTDLYGRDNLLKLNDKLRGITQRRLEEKIWWFQNKPTYIVVLILMLAFDAVLYIAGQAVKKHQFKIPLPHNFIYPLLLLPLSMMLVWILPYIILSFSKPITALIKFILKRAPLNGIMLLAGSMLFVIAKIIAILNV